MSVLNQAGGKHMHRDSYGRFAADSKSGDNTSLGWNDFMTVAEFLEPEAGYMLDGTAVFSTSFHIIRCAVYMFPPCLRSNLLDPPQNRFDV